MDFNLMTCTDTGQIENPNLEYPLLGYIGNRLDLLCADPYAVENTQEKNLKKSYVAQLLLTLLFGPLGLFYSSVAAAIAMLIAAIVFSLMTYGAALLLIWPLCVIIGLVAVMKYNDKVELEEDRHRQLIDAMKASQRNG